MREMITFSLKIKILNTLNKRNLLLLVLRHDLSLV